MTDGAGAGLVDGRLQLSLALVMPAALLPSGTRPVTFPGEHALVALLEDLGEPLA
jgi:hypothetical protein